jgi:hypothetical protein
MTPSIQSQIMAAAVAVTNGAAGAQSWRTRMAAFNPGELPAINILPDEGDAEYLDTDSIDRKFVFKVRHITQAVDQCDAAIDPVYVAASKALLSDPTLGGLVRFLRENSQKWEMEKGEYDTVALVVLYQAEFSTTRSDPSVACG